MAAFLTPPSLHWTRSVHDRVPRLCRAPALGSCSCPFSGRGAPVAAVGVRFLAPLSMPNGPVGAAFRWTPDRGQTTAAPTFTASTLTPAMGGDDGVHPVNAGRVSTSSTLNPQEVAACASSASFVQLVGAVGPTRSAGSDVVWASALAVTLAHPLWSWTARTRCGRPSVNCARSWARQPATGPSSRHQWRQRMTWTNPRSTRT